VQDAVDELRFLVYTYSAETDQSMGPRQFDNPLYHEMSIPPMRERQGEDPNKPYKFYRRPERGGRDYVQEQVAFQQDAHQRDLEMKHKRDMQDLERRIRQEEKRKFEDQRRRDLDDLEKRFADLRLELMRTAGPQQRGPPGMAGPRRDMPAGGRANAVSTTEEEVEEMPDFLPPAYTRLTMKEEEEPKQAKTVRFKEEVDDIEHAGPFGLYSRSPKVGANTSAWANRQPMPMEWAQQQQQRSSSSLLEEHSAK